MTAAAPRSVAPAAFARARAAARGRLGLRNDRQLVVCGFPRGGTSLLYNMLSATLPGFRFAEFEQAAAKTLPLPGDRASKWPMDVLRLPRVVNKNAAGLRKDLLFVIVVRDLRDVITSVHPNAPDRYFCGYADRWSPRGGHPYTLVATDQGVAAVHAGIRRAFKLRDVGAATVVRVDYEALVADADAVQAHLADALGLRFDGRFSGFAARGDRHAYRYEGARAPVDAARAARENAAVDPARTGRWRRPEFAARLRQQFTAHPELFALLRHYGHAADDRWFEDLPAADLPGTAADGGPGRPAGVPASPPVRRAA